MMTDSIQKLLCWGMILLSGCVSAHKGTNPEITQLESSFLSDPSFDPNKKFEYDETLLQKEAHYRFQKPNLNVMQKLIDRGADVNAQDEFGFTPLHACRDLNAAKLLVKNGARLDIVTKKGLTPLDLVCSEADRLSYWDGDDIDWVVDVAEFLAEKGAKFSENFKLHNFKCKRLVLLVLKHGGASAIEYTCEPGDYPTSIAAQQGDLPYLKKLVALGALFKVSHHDGEKGIRGIDGHPLIYARSIPMLKFLLHKGAHIDDPAFMACTTLLREATYEGNYKIAKFCLDHGANINAVGGTCGARQTPLMIACTHAKDAKPELLKKYFRIVKLLIARGADVNAVDVWGETALFDAVLFGDVRCVEYLLKHGAEIGNTEINNQTKEQTAHHQRVIARISDYIYIEPEHFFAISNNNGSTNAPNLAYKQICEHTFSPARQREMSSIIDKNKRYKIPSKYVSWLKVLAGAMTVKQYWESCNAMEHANDAIDGPLYQWDDESLERCHCFVQLVFPTFDPSQFVGGAPYIDPTFLELLASIKDSCLREEYDALTHQIQNVLIINFERVARFWGIRWRNGAFAVVDQDQFTKATKVNPHNKQRMTRVLIALCALGMKKTAEQFYRCLSEVDQASGGRAGPAQRQSLRWILESWRPSAQRLRPMGLRSRADFSPSPMRFRTRRLGETRRLKAASTEWRARGLTTSWKFPEVTVTVSGGARSMRSPVTLTS
jgi:ankyrin repeat protein